MKVMIVLLACFISNAFACGGRLLSESEVLEDPKTQVALKRVESLVGEELALKKIVMSGNEILDINEVVVASAMCNANYVNLFHVSLKDPRVMCLTRAASSAYGFMKLEMSYCVLANGSNTQTIWY